jgi:hypothetical protein
VVLGFIANMDNAQIPPHTATSILPLGRPLHVRFQEHAAGADAPSSGDVGQAATLLDRPLATRPTPSHAAQLRQAALPIKGGGLGHTVPSDIVMPAYIGSRLDTADAVAAMPGMRDAVAASHQCSDVLVHQVAANQVPTPLGATRWDVPTLRNLTPQKTQHTLQSHIPECRGRSVWPTRHARTCGHSRGEPQDIRLSQPRGGHTRVDQDE